MRSPLRWIVVVLAVIAAAALSISITAGVWWTIGPSQVGPLGTEMCGGGECSPRGLAWLGDDLWQRYAIATAAAGLITAFLALLVGGAVAAGRVPRIVAQSLIAGIVTALVAGALFVHGIKTFAETSIDRGLVLFVIGLVAALAVAALVLRRPRTLP